MALKVGFPLVYSGSRSINEHLKPQAYRHEERMTSTHRMVTLIIVWLSIAFASVILFANSLFLPPPVILLVAIALLAAALLATSIIMRGGNSEA
jgi:hypothetical protein